MRSHSQTPTTWRKPQIYYLSRSLICVVVAFSLGTLFIPVSSFLLRTYLIFLGTESADTQFKILPLYRELWCEN
jgi:hypothetical protein